MGLVLTHSAKYKPMSFERLIQPYVMATEEYRLLEKEMATLEEEAATVKTLAERAAIKDASGNIDMGVQQPEYVQNYLDYAKELEDAAEKLSVRGLKGINRKSIYDLQSNYRTKIRPIEEAADYVKEKAKEQQALNNAAKGRLRFDVNFSDPSIMQRVIDSNNTLGYNVYDLDNYAKNAILEGTALKNAQKPIATVHPENSQYNIVTQGIAPELLDGNTDIEAIVNNLAADVPEHLREEFKTEIRNKVKEAAVATSKLEVNKNFNSDLDWARYNLSLAQFQAAQDQQQAAALAAAEKAKLNNEPLSTRSLIFPQLKAKVDDLLETNGNIKYMSELTDYSGKFIRPKYERKETGTTPTGIPMYVDNQYLINQYDKIKNILISHGITQEQLDEMSINEVNNIINTIKQGNNDALLKNVISVPFNTNGTSYFMSTLKTLGIVPKLIKSFTSNSKDTKGIGQYNTVPIKSFDKIKFDDSKDMMFFEYDKENNIPIMMLNGNYYKLPKDIFDNKTMQLLAEYSDPEKSKQEQELIMQYPYMSEQDKIKNYKAYQTALTNASNRNAFYNDLPQRLLRQYGTVNVTGK